MTSYHTKMILVACVFLSVFLLHSVAIAKNKVVVIPLNSSKAPTCITRESAYEHLDTWYKHINVSCLAGETLMTGGFTYGAYSTNLNCRVLESRPVGNEWHVTWGMPTESECASGTAKTFAVCCTW